MPDIGNLRGAKLAPSSVSVRVTKKTPVLPIVKVKNSVYLITCDFKFFNTILAKCSGDPSIMSHISHGSSVQWVLWVMDQAE
jgi:hypothetical protein